MKLRRDGQPDGRSKRATHQRWLREHAPLVYIGLYNPANGSLLERKRRAELESLARIRRDALAYCIDCRNPLIATEQGFQYCPYGRAGQHDKVRRALGLEGAQGAVVTLDREAARRRRQST